MAVVVRGIAVLLAVAAVSNAETFKESLYTDEVSPSNLNQTAISEELALQDPEKDGEDFTEDSGDAAFQKKENGKENVVWSYIEMASVYSALYPERQFASIVTVILWLLWLSLAKFKGLYVVSENNNNAILT